jgi:hypothetical protein
MKVFGLAMIVLFSITGMGPSVADAMELRYQSITCGDHWLKIEIKLDADSNRATVEYSGDSNPEKLLDSAVYEFSSADSVRIQLTGEQADSILIDGSDAVHNIFWGSMINGKTKSQTSLGLCSVE